MGATKTIVTKEFAFVGMRVCRGVRWQYGSEDQIHGKPVPGTIVSIPETSGGARVRWDGKTSELHYNTGQGGLFDLCLWEDDVVETPKSVDLTGVGGKISKGDLVEFVQHLSDSKGSSTQLEIGKQYKVSMGNDAITAGRISIEEAGLWLYEAECFRKISPPKVIVTTSVLSLSSIKPGDEVRLYQHVADSEAGGLAIGSWYKVTRVLSDTSCIYPLNIERLTGGIWGVKLECFDQVRTPEVPKLARKIFLEDSDIRVGDLVHMCEHLSDSKAGGLVEGKWYRVVGKKSSEPKILIGDNEGAKNSYGGWWVSTKCFDNATPPFTRRLSEKDIDIGDTVTYYTSWKSKETLVPGNTYKVTGKLCGKVSVEGCYESFHPESFCSVTKKPKEKVEEIRDKMITVIKPKVEEEISTVHIHGDGSVSWTGNPKAGEYLICTFIKGSGVKFKRGDTVYASSDTQDGVQFRPSWETTKEMICYWAPYKEGKAWLDKRAPTITSASISQTIKTKKDDRHKSRVSSSPGHTGSAFKVCRPTATFRKGQVHRGSAVRVRASQARSGRAHS